MAAPLFLAGGVPDAAAVRGMRRLVEFASLASMAVGAASLLQWSDAVPVLRRLFPAYEAITAAAAFAHLGSGGALWLLRDEPAAPRQPRAVAARVLAATVAVLAAGALAGAVPMPRLMALSFLLVSLALLALDWTVMWRAQPVAPAQVLAFAANGAAAIALFDYVESDTSASRVALQASAAAFLLSYAVACARPRWGVGALLASPSDGGILTRRLWPANVFVPLLVGALCWEAHSAGLWSAWAAMTAMILAMVTLLAVLTVWSGQSIERADLQRRRAAAELLHVNRALRALSLCNEALVRASDEAAWLHQLCHIVVGDAGYRLCWVGRANGDEAKTVTVLAHAGFDEGYLRGINVSWGDDERGRGPTGTSIRTGETQIVADTATDPMFAPWRRDALARGFASVVAIPLAVNGEPFGALTIYAAEHDAFHPKEVNLLGELARDLAFGIEGLRTRREKAEAEAQVRRLNAELEDRVRARTADLEAARDREAQTGFRIQQMLLLTQPPTDIPGLQVAALTLPSARIDGDFYDFFKHDAQHIDVVVADVMGKGTYAALLAGATKSNVLEALCHLLSLAPNGPLPEPKEIVTLAHADMVRQLVELESFVTLSYARVDLVRHVLDLVDCGHTGTVVLRGRTGECEIVHGDNLPLGIREGELFTQVAVPFETGDSFLFYSDGITEMRNPAGELFGAARLLACVREHRALEPEALVEAVRRTAVAFGQSRHLADDLTCVALKIGEAHHPLSRRVIEIGSDLQDLRSARAFVRDVCRGIPEQLLDTDAAAALELAVNEAASNIMRHAYHGRVDQRIQLEAETFLDRVVIRLHHLGDAFDPAGVPPPALDGSRESGFGLYLIARTVDAVRYSRDERGRNCVALVKALGVAHAEG